MPIESGQPRKEIMEAEWQELERLATYWLARTQETTKGASLSCLHVLNNLAGAIMTVEYRSAMPIEKHPELFDGATKAIEYIEKYYKLLDEFPEFAEQELKEGNGYFPEMLTEIRSSKEFVDEQERKLRATTN